MIEIAPRWRILAAGVAAATVGVLGLAGPTASAQPLVPQPPQPVPTPAATAPSAQITTQQGVAPDTGVVSVGTGTAPAATPGAVTAPAPVIAPATSGTIHEFLESRGVTLEPQSSKDFTALNIVLPMPRGWSHVPDPNVPDAFAVIADRVGGDGLYTSNAQLVVYKLVGGEFDPKEAISHGFIDAQQLPAWRSTAASFADWGGMPSSLIEGTYRDNSLTLNTSRRHVLASTDTDRYLVSLAVTTSVDQAVAAAQATDAIVNGFRVAVPGQTPPAAPAQPAIPAAPGAMLPATPGTTASPVVPGTVSPVSTPATATGAQPLAAG
ncbi:LpqN/LpqT family lipoprotein [Mycolicibacterium phlei]